MVEGRISKVKDGSASYKVGEASAPKADDFTVTQRPHSSSSEFGHEIAQAPLMSYENDASAPLEIWDGSPCLLDEGRHIAWPGVRRQTA
jgi:hypothetical protein